MYYQDSIIVIQSEENKLWQARYESQKQYSDSCDAMTKSCVLVAKNYKSENDMLHKQLKCKTILLRVFQTTTAASLLTLFILL